MPDSWDPKRYRERAKEWRDRAASLPEGRERDACVTIAEGYIRLAEIIEAQGLSRRQTGAAIIIHSTKNRSRRERKKARRVRFQGHPAGKGSLTFCYSPERHPADLL